MTTIEQGRAGEDRATRLLRAAGMALVERNYRCKLGELDLVARDGQTLVFVEVRTRSRADRGTALETVNAAKRQRLARVAAFYLAARKPACKAIRFDVIGITADEVVHIRDAFRLG